MKLRRDVSAYTDYPWHEQHKEELKAYARNYRENNPEYKARNAEKAKQARLADPEFFKAREFSREMKKYNTTVEEYRDKLILQSGLCAICGHLSHHHGTLQRLQVDHDHICCDLKTKSCGKCLRGLLCADCNVLLSYLERFMKDFPSDHAEIYLRNTSSEGSWTKKALRYLKSYDRTQFEYIRAHNEYETQETQNVRNLPSSCAINA